jgi:hypothetical protein
VLNIDRTDRLVDKRTVLDPFSNDENGGRNILGVLECNIRAQDE